MPTPGDFVKTIALSTELPQWTPGEMILTLAPSALKRPSDKDPFARHYGLRLRVWAALETVRVSFGLQRVEPLIQDGHTVWPQGPLTHPPEHSHLPHDHDDHADHSLFAWGETASLRPDPIFAEGDWRRVENPFTPEASEPGFPVYKLVDYQKAPVGTAPTEAQKLERRRWLLLRFGPGRLDASAATITALLKTILGGMMASCTRVPLRWIVYDFGRPADPYEVGPAVKGPTGGEWPGHRPGSEIPVHDPGPPTQGQIESEPTAQEKMQIVFNAYTPDWNKQAVKYDAAKVCLETATPVIAVLDSGVDAYVPGVPGSDPMWDGNPSLLLGKAAEYGYVATKPDGAAESNDCLDIFGHGTHVTSILCGREYLTPPVSVDDPARYVPPGIVPNAKAIHLKVAANAYFTTPSGGRYFKVDTVRYYSALSKVLNDPIYSAVKAINLSVGASVEDPLEFNNIKALAAQGKFCVAAAGNHEKTESPNVLYPAGYAETISVGAYRIFVEIALDAFKTGSAVRLPFEWEHSNRGGANGALGPKFADRGVSVDVLAPGRNIHGALPMYSVLLFKDKTSAMLSGTSMAAPNVAALVAVHASNTPSATFASVLEALRATDDVAWGANQTWPTGLAATIRDASKLQLCPPPPSTTTP